jgi:hypothetical protein
MSTQLIHFVMKEKRKNLQYMFHQTLDGKQIFGAGTIATATAEVGQPPDHDTWDDGKPGTLIPVRPQKREIDIY